MNRAVPLIAALAAVLIGVCWWLVLRDPPRPAASAQPAESADASPAQTAKSRDEPPSGTAAVPSGSRKIAALVRKLQGGELRGHLSRETVDRFLESRGRSAVSLLAAWEESDRREFLDEAKERFPDDPAVHLAAILAEESADARAAWIGRFKKSAPANPLADWLAASENFLNVEPAAALAELRAAAGKTDFQTYTKAGIAERRALFLAAGIPPMEADIMAFYMTKLGYAQTLQAVSRDLSLEYKNVVAKGDAQAVLDLSASAIGMGRVLSDPARSGSFLLEQSIGLAIEQKAVERLDAAQAAQLLGGPVKARLETLQRQQDEIKTLVKAGDPTDGKATDAEFTEYFQRMTTEGELRALRWLAGRRAGK